MPHPDFFEFLDSGHALLRAQLPQTFKRGPVFSLLIPSIGRFLQGEAPDRIAAEWINVLLLPANAILVYLIARRWCAHHAVWASAVFLLMPLSAYCTSHLIVEPLLLFLVLLTIWIRMLPRGADWSYALAALASITRYDAAGLIVGLLGADLIARRPTRPALLRAAAAFLPLASWLALTAYTWSSRSYDHYLSQIAQRSAAEIFAAFPGAFLDAVRLGFDTIFDVSGDSHRLLLPDTLIFLDNPVRFSLYTLVVAATLIGAIRTCVSRDPAAITSLITLAAYFAVHAVFPFQFLRFGYPPAALLILFAAIGVAAVFQTAVRTLGRRRSHDAPLPSEPGRESLTPQPHPSHSVRLPASTPPTRFPNPIPIRESGLARFLVTTFGLAAILFLVLALRGEADSLGALGGASHRWSIPLTVLKLAAITFLWAAAARSAHFGIGRVAALLSAMVLASLQSRNTIPLLGSGIEGKNQVEAARWIRDHAQPEARVLSASPGLLRLYVARLPDDRFPGFQNVAADHWDDILRECRDAHIQFIIWHDNLKQEHGGYYSDKWRLARFDCLANPEALTGVTVERRFTRFPDLLILRVNAN